MNDSAPTKRRWRGSLAVLIAAAAFAIAGCSSSGDVVAYDLPAGSQRYTFEAETDGAKTVWEYTSEKPNKRDAPKLDPCMGDVIGDNRAACRPEPLIFLRYDFDLALDNTTEARHTHRIKVVGYYQERLTAPPMLASMKVEASFDGGKTWQPQTTKAAGKNTFTADIKNPSRDQAPEGVGLRINATDSQGDTVKQTLPTAYKLH